MYKSRVVPDLPQVNVEHKGACSLVVRVGVFDLQLHYHVDWFARHHAFVVALQLLLKRFKNFFHFRTWRSWRRRLLPPCMPSFLGFSCFLIKFRDTWNFFAPPPGFKSAWNFWLLLRMLTKMLSGVSSNSTCPCSSIFCSCLREATIFFSGWCFISAENTLILVL